MAIQGADAREALASMHSTAATHSMLSYHVDVRIGLHSVAKTAEMFLGRRQRCRRSADRMDARNLDPVYWRKRSKGVYGWSDMTPRIWGLSLHTPDYFTCSWQVVGTPLRLQAMRKL